MERCVKSEQHRLHPEEDASSRRKTGRVASPEREEASVWRWRKTAGEASPEIARARGGFSVAAGHSDQMWTSSERFYPNVDNFGTFLPKCGQDGSGYSKPLPLLFPVVVGNIAGDAPPPLILRLFLSFRLHEFEREIGGGSRARAGLRPKKKGRLVTHRRFPSQTHAAASSETAAVSKVAARLRRCSHPLPEKEEVAVSNIQSRLVHIWVKTFRTCSHLGKNVPNLSTFGPSHLLKPDRIGSRSYDLDPDPTIPFTILQIYDLIAIRLEYYFWWLYRCNPLTSTTPGGKTGSIAALTATLATAVTLTGGVNNGPTKCYGVPFLMENQLHQGGNNGVGKTRRFMDTNGIEQLTGIWRGIAYVELNPAIIDDIDKITPNENPTNVKVCFLNAINNSK
ncbi:hypothetical protein LXL04_005937 [Taraxacum kok-saghyz]